MRSGRSRSSCAFRLGEDVPTTAPLLQLLDRGRADEPVADIASRPHRGDVDLIRPDALDVLHRMDAEIDFFGEQRPVELLGPQPLAADLRERPVLYLVAGRRDLDDLDPAVGPALRRLDRGSHLARLRQRQRRSASSEAKSLHASPLVQLERIRQRAGREMTVILGLESSCDDSAVALVTSDRRILAQAVVGPERRRISPMAAWCRRSPRAPMSRSCPA